MAVDPRVETLALLRSIDASLKQLLQRTPTAASAPPAVAAIADDRELDSQYGDPEVKFTPKHWTGESYKGRKMSECPPEFLEVLAAAFDYFAERDEASGELASNGKPKALYARKDAARARGWAKRHQARGWKPEPSRAPLEDTWETPNDGEWR